VKIFIPEALYFRPGIGSGPGLVDIRLILYIEHDAGFAFVPVSPKPIPVTLSLQIRIRYLLLKPVMQGQEENDPLFPAYANEGVCLFLEAFRRGDDELLGAVSAKPFVSSDRERREMQDTQDPQSMVAHPAEIPTPDRRIL
jgi:hypothetical protein